jgi:hypothetical protein
MTISFDIKRLLFPDTRYLLVFALVGGGLMRV